MKYVYAVTQQSDFFQFQDFASRYNSRLSAYLKYLSREYGVQDLPRAIVWASADTATNLISNIPIPGYTNEFRTVFCPDIGSWRNIYLLQLDETDNVEIRRYYEADLTENHVLQILGHEFVHHSDLFIDEAYERARWFEEGMCEYISRKYFLTDAQFTEAARINRLLVEQFQKKHGKASLENFSADTYWECYAGIFYAYWCSYLAIEQLVDRYKGDIMAVFREYHRWYNSGKAIPLSCWFRIEEKDIR